MRKVIQNTAERIVTDAGIVTLPVCPLVIAQNANILVEAKPIFADGVSGMFLKVGENFGILYSTYIRSIGFQNFSIGHELGHYYLEGHADAVLRMGPHSSKAGFVSNDRYEREADLFAASLLMPEDIFKREMGAAGFGLKAIERLAEVAKTSLTSTAFRFQELSRDAVAVALSCGAQVDVCFYSDRFKDFKPPYMQKGTPVPEGCLTADFNRIEAKVLGAAADEGETRFTDWFGVDGPRLREEVKGLGSYGKTLTILTCDAKSEDDYDPLEEADDDEYLRERWTPRFHR
jgi:hypothetical protein